MKQPVQPIDPLRLKAFPLRERASMCRIDDILIDAAAPPPPCPDALAVQYRTAADRIRHARERGAAVLCFYGAHLVKNGASSLVQALVRDGWITHLATNGAGVIHDWEFAFQQWSTESVRDNVATGTFGTWEETGRWLHMAVLAGALRPEGFGASVGRFIEEGGLDLPEPDALADQVRAAPDDALAPARAELLVVMKQHGVKGGRHAVAHPWKHTSILASAFAHDVALTVHPGIGYDIIATHPMFNGAALGRAAGIDFHLIGGTIDQLDEGVVLSIGSAIMAPQVFEKSLSCVNNLRLQAGRPIVSGLSFHVVDLQDGGGWDWTTGEPPKDNPAYYLRFCKSFSRMGGTMHYLQSDNVLFLQHLVHLLAAS